MKKYFLFTSLFIFINFYANSQLRSNDAAILSVDSPMAFCGGMEDIIVTVANMGDNRIDSVQIHWMFNGVVKPIFNYLQLLDTTNGSNPNSAQVTIGNEMFTAGTSNSIKVWTSLPNGSADTINSNDTIELVIKAGLTGNYTLDSNYITGSGNYQSFSELASDLNNFGVCGPVNVIVSPGVYNDFIYLTQIEGASAINTITIDGQDSITVSLVHDATSRYSTVTLDGTDYVTIKNMSIEASGSSGSSILFANSANYNLIQSNILKASTTSSSSNISNVIFSGNINSSSTGANANYNTIANNEIVGGYYGLRAYGSSGNLNVNNKVVKNIIKDVYLCGINVYYQDSLELIGNNIKMNSRNNANSDGIFAYYSNNTLFRENYIHASDFGAYFYNINTYAPSTRKMQIINNMIISDGDYGLYISYVDSADIYHNSISVNGTVNPAIQIEGGASPRNIENYNVLNNIFSSGYTEAFETNVPDTIFDKLDHNIYYTGGNVLIRIKDSIYSSLLDYTTSNPMLNPASLEGNPQFLSPVSNLKMIGTIANDVGSAFPGTTYDIEGDPRPFPLSSQVDIGADEYNPPTCLPPSNLGVSNVSLTTAEIFWDGGINTFEYEYGMQGFYQGNGIANSSINDTVSITGLQSDTWYEFYVREDCGRGDFSYWRGPFKFKTLKGIPFYEDFESFAAGISSNPWPNDWFSNTSSDPNWESENATGSNKNSANTGPLYDHSLFGSPGGIYMYMETNSGTVGDSALLISPPIFIDSNNAVFKLEYWYFNYGALIDKMDVLIESNGTTELIASYIGQQQSAQTDEWRLGSHILTGYEGKSIRIIFKGFNVACCTGDIAIDDVSLQSVPSVDAGIYEIVNPVDIICPGISTPVVKLGNYGSDTLRSVKIKYSINNILDSVLYNGLLPPGEFSNVSLNPVNFVSNVVYDMDFYTEGPNSLLDTVHYNDTLSLNGIPVAMQAGNYTIDTSIARSGTNFHTINEAILALETFGICGPVIFNLAEGHYYEQLTLDQEILGSSEINTITFDGGDSSRTTIIHDATVVRPVILFDGGKYYNFVNLGIENTATTNSVGIVFTNGSAYNNISNCRVKVNTSSTSSSNYCIVSSGSLTTATTAGLNGDFLTIENNHIIGGFYGIRLNGSAVMNYGNYIFNNRIDSSYSFGIYVSDQDSVIIEGNIIDLQDRNYQGGDGIWLNECMNFSILSNEIYVPHYGIYAFDANSDLVPRQRAKIVNNMIISTGGDVFQHYGVYLNDGLNIDFLHNSIHVVSSSQNALYINGGATDSLDIRNNIFSSVSTALVDINVPLSSISQFDNNIFYTSGNTIAQLNGKSLDDLDSLRAEAPLFNQNSLQGDPGFISTVSDLHIAPGALLANDKGDNSANVSTDIDGQSRPISGSSSVDIGADEFAPPALNVGIASLFDPSGVICPGTYSPVVGVMNTGEDTIYSVKIVFSVNGIMDSILNTDTILSSEILNVTLNPISIISGTTYDIVVYTKDPNGVHDVLNYDDTLSMSNAETALVGTYSIDSSQTTSGTNFRSFADLLYALDSRGICGAVEVNIVQGSGPYNEQIFFAEVAGSNPANTITINGNGEEVQYGSNTNNERGVFNFNNASDIVLNDLVINSEGGSYGYGVHILDGSHDITINNCTIQNNSSQANTSGIVMSGSATNPTIQGNAYNITITNNTIIGGQYGIALAGTWLANSIGNIVSNNKISDFSYGIYATYNDSLIVENNELHHPDLSTMFRIYGIYSAGNENAMFNRNSIHDIYASSNNLDIYPIGISGGSSTGNQSYFMNSLIYNINSDSGNVYGIFDRGSDWTHFLNNTIALDDTAASNGEIRGIYQTSPSTGSSFLNNLITLNKGASLGKFGISLADNTTMLVNYNNVFIGVNSLTNYYGSLGANNYTDLANWQLVGYGTNSLDVNPIFSSTSIIYTPTNSLLDSAGLSLTEVSEDFYGRTRSSFPDIGAVEFAPPKVFDLELLNFVRPTQLITSCYTSVENLELQIVNRGDTAIDFTNDTTNIRVLVSNAASQIFDLELNDNSLNNGFAFESGDTILVSVGNMDMITVGTYEFKAYVSLNLDSIQTNDTISMDIVNSVSGGLLSSNIDTLCGPGQVTLSVINSIGDIQWQRLVAGVFADEIGADSISYDVFVDSTVTFRVVACGTEISDTLQVHVNEIPVAPSTINDTVNVMCGLSGNAVLIATSSNSDAEFNWYDAATAGNFIVTADSLLHPYSSTITSPALNYADTFYVAEVSNGCEGPRSMVLALITIEKTIAPTVVGDTSIVFCGDSGTAVLFASSNNSSDIFAWYDNATAGNLLLVADTMYYGVSTIPQSTTTLYTDSFYVAAIDSLSLCESERRLVSGTVVCTVGTEELFSALDGISIHPNPSKGVFQIQGHNIGGELIITIFNANGKKVYEHITVGNNFDEIVDLSDLSKGMYFIKLQSGELMETRKLIIH